MVPQPVEWVLTVYYGPEAHRATYGRQVRSNRYTKDYIQLSRKQEFLETVASLFSVTASASGSIPLTYRWPAGTTPGAFVFNSADRPHLKWGTSLGAPQVWKMIPAPSDATAETIPGDPSHLEFEDAEREFALLADRGAGQPYLLAIKLREDPRTLHLRTYLKNPSAAFAWANVTLLPAEIQALVAKTSQNSALAWSIFSSGGSLPTPKIEKALSQLASSKDLAKRISAFDNETGRALADYLKHPGSGVFFDPARNHNAWVRPAALPAQVAASIDDLLQGLDARFPVIPQSDAAAELLEVDPENLESFRNQIAEESYAVPDSIASVKVRGSAQRAFADAVKANYGYRCAITGMTTNAFLVASHIVPWSEDQGIRLDPSNGICLSLFVDRAFEKGYLQIDDDLTVRIEWSKVGDDGALRSQLEPYSGKKLRKPKQQAPRPNYLQRRRKLVSSIS